MVIINIDLERAIAEKDLGNTHYKKKEFCEALECYNRAIQIDATNIAFYTNKAAVYFELGEYEKCREECFTAVRIGRDHNSNVKLISKAFTRIGNSFLKQKNVHDAKDYFLKSLAEYETKEVKDKVKQCDREIEEQKRIAYINPDIADTERTEGDKCFTNGDLETSLTHYSEAVKRNPNDPTLYLRRAASLTRLFRQQEALVDCDKCLEKDPNSIKGYICKGSILESVHDYDGAMDSYSKALERDPNNIESLQAYYRCLDKDYKSRNDTCSVISRAAADPSVNASLSSEGSVDTISGLDCLSFKFHEHLEHDPDAMRKLIEYGLIKFTD